MLVLIAQSVGQLFFTTEARMLGVPRAVTVGMPVMVDNIKIRIPGYDHEFELSSVMTPDRGFNIYKYFLESLYFLDLPGQICEFGVYMGETSKELGKYLNLVGSNRKLIMLDTFDGNPGSDGLYRGTVSDVMKIMSGISGYMLYIGLMSTHIPLFKDYISFAHIDCDLYEGTRDSIIICDRQTFKGTYVVIDDYDTVTWPGVKAACDEFLHPDRWEIIKKLKGQLVVRKTCNL